MSKAVVSEWEEDSSDGGGGEEYKIEEHMRTPGREDDEEYTASYNYNEMLSKEDQRLLQNTNNNNNNNNHEEYTNQPDGYKFKIEEYRKIKDIIYRFMDYKEVEFQRGHLRDLFHNFRMEFGDPNEPETYLGEQVFEIFEWVIEHSHHINAQHTLWFFGMYLSPALVIWLLYGDPKRNVPPPSINDTQRFRVYLEKKLPELCESLLSGHGGMNINSFVRAARVEYVATVGLPEPPITFREEYEAQRHEMRMAEMNMMTMMESNNNNNSNNKRKREYNHKTNNIKTKAGKLERGKG